MKILARKYNYDSSFDGLKGFVTNDFSLNPTQIIEHYTNLWHIERAFRISKTDLKIRPIYHRLEHRIYSHILISFVAYTVYKEFDREKHVYNNLTVRPTINDVMLAVDFGYTNPTAVLRIERDSDNHYWVAQEWYKTGKTTPEIIEHVKSHNPRYVYADPAEPDKPISGRRKT